MKAHGLKSIINLRGDEETDLWESKLANSLEINYYSKTLDAREKQDLDYLEEILSIVENSENQPVLLHCLGGKDRTGLIIGMYKLKNTDICFENLQKEMIMYGYDIDNYTEVISALKEYQRKLEKSD